MKIKNYNKQEAQKRNHIEIHRYLQSIDCPKILTTITVSKRTIYNKFSWFILARGAEMSEEEALNAAQKFALQSDGINVIYKKYEPSLLDLESPA